MKMNGTVDLTHCKSNELSEEPFGIRESRAIDY